MNSADKLNAELLRASTLCDLSRSDEAANLLAKIVAVHPDSARAWCLTARAALESGDDALALRAAKAAISLEPEGEWPHRLMSVALWRSGQRDAALTHAREAARVEPGEFRTFTNLAHLLSGRAATRAEARAAAQHALALAPDEVEAHMADGAVAAADGRRAEAVAAYRRVLAIDPDHSRAHHQLATLSLPRRRFALPRELSAAATRFASAVRANPRATASVSDLDHVLQSFLTNLAYFMLFDGYLAANGDSDGQHPVFALIAVIALVLPALYALAFLTGVDTVVRGRLAGLLVHDRWISVAAAFEGLAVGLLVAALADVRGTEGFASGGAISALAGRLVLWRRSKRR